MKQLFPALALLIMMSSCGNEFNDFVNSYPEKSLPVKIVLDPDATTDYQEVDSVGALNYLKDIAVPDGADYLSVQEYIDTYFSPEEAEYMVTMQSITAIPQENFTALITYVDMFDGMNPMQFAVLHTFTKSGEPIDAGIIGSSNSVPNGWEPSVTSAEIVINEDFAIETTNDYYSWNRNDPEADGISETNVYQYQVDENGNISQ